MTVRKVVDTISGEEAARALLSRRHAILQSAGVGSLTWGAYAHFVRLGLRALSQGLRASGETIQTATLDDWQALANVRTFGKKIQKAATLKPSFTERKGDFYVEHKPGADRLRVSVDVVTPGQRGRTGEVKEYGFAVSFTRDGQPLTVTKSAAPRGVVKEWAAAARERLRAEEEDERVVHEHLSKAVAKLSARKAAQLTAFARREWGISLSPVVVAVLLVCTLTAGSAFAAYTAYRIYKHFVVTNELRDGGLPSRLRPHGKRVQVSDDIEMWRDPAHADSIAFTYRNPERLVRDFRAMSPMAKNGETHIEWEWKIAFDSGPVMYKLTEPPVLNVVFPDAATRHRLRLVDVGIGYVHHTEDFSDRKTSSRPEDRDREDVLHVGGTGWRPSPLMTPRYGAANPP